MCDVRACAVEYEGLKLELHRLGCIVVETTYISPCDAGKAGYFEPKSMRYHRGEVKGRISVYRPERVDVPGDPCDELVILAHEAGHFESQERSLRTEELLTASDRFEAEEILTPIEKKLILREELRAWEFGRRRLATREFTDWARFDGHIQAGLEQYCQRMSVPYYAWETIDTLLDAEYPPLKNCLEPYPPGA